MGFVISEGDRSVGLELLGYEFPQAEGDGFDANWLRVGVRCAIGADSREYEDCCLRSNEVAEIAEALESVLRGERSGAIMSFMEPYLMLSAARTGENFVFLVQYVYDTAGSAWKYFSVSQTMDAQTLSGLCGELRRMYARFPYREPKE